MRQYKDPFEERTDPRGRTYYWLAREIVELEGEDDTNVGANQGKKISITPIQHDLTHYLMIEKVRAWLSDLEERI